MPANRSHSRPFSKYQLDYFGDLTLLNLLDWLTILSLGGLLAAMTLQLGGVRAETQIIGVWLTGAMLVFHGLWLAARREPFTIKKHTLVFGPFFLWALMSWLFITPATWIARGEVLLILQAILVLWVTTHNAQTRNHVWFLFIVLAGISGAGVLMALNQYFHDARWLPKLFNPLEFQTYRITGHAQYEGRASGPFGSPNSFAALMILAFFPAALAALAPRLPGIIRVFCGYLALLFLGGLALTLSRGGMIVLLPGLFLLPWVLRLPRRTQVFFSCGLLAVLLGTALAAAFFSPRFLDRWENFIQESGERTRPAMWQGTLGIIQEHPITGSGLGSFRYQFDRHRPEGFIPSPDHAHNDYLEIISDLGLIGFALLFLPAAWLWLRSLRAWRAMPDKVALNEVNTRRRRAKVIPIPKLFLGATLLSLACLGLHLLVEFHLHIPALLFWIAFSFGILVKYTPGSTWELAPRKKPLLLAGLALLALGPGLGFLTLATHKAEIYAFEGKRQAEHFSQNFNQLRNNREFLEGRITLLEAAIQENPGHGEAHRQLALALADLSYAAPMRRTELGRRAEEHARTAINGFPMAAAFWTTLGETLFLQERWEEAGEAYRHATELAPYSAEAWYYYANWLNGEKGRRQEALASIERCLELDPDNEQARDLRRRILIP